MKDTRLPEILEPRREVPRTSAILAYAARRKSFADEATLDLLSDDSVTWAEYRKERDAIEEALCAPGTGMDSFRKVVSIVEGILKNEKRLRDKKDEKLRLALQRESRGAEIFQSKLCEAEEAIARLQSENEKLLETSCRQPTLLEISELGTLVNKNLSSETQRSDQATAITETVRRTLRTVRGLKQELGEFRRAVADEVFVRPVKETLQAGLENLQELVEEEVAYATAQGNPFSMGQLELLAPRVVKRIKKHTDELRSAVQLAGATIPGISDLKLPSTEEARLQTVGKCGETVLRLLEFSVEMASAVASFKPPVAELPQVAAATVESVAVQTNSVLCQSEATQTIAPLTSPTFPPHQPPRFSIAPRPTIHFSPRSPCPPLGSPFTIMSVNTPLSPRKGSQFSTAAPLKFLPPPTKRKAKKHSIGITTQEFAQEVTKADAAVEVSIAQDEPDRLQSKNRGREHRQQLRENQLQFLYDQPAFAVDCEEPLPALIPCVPSKKAAPAPRRQHNGEWGKILCEKKDTTLPTNSVSDKVLCLPPCMPPPRNFADHIRKVRYMRSSGAFESNKAETGLSLEATSIAVASSEHNFTDAEI